MERILKGVLCDIKLSDPELYVNNEARNRSGHMGHAIVEYADGCVLDFSANTSSYRARGHSGYGWMELRRSTDRGKTWSDLFDFRYSKQALFDGIFTVSVEKAVACSDGTIVAFCLRHYASSENCCTPWLSPTYVKSYDGGNTWTDAKELSTERGRVYDVLYHDGRIYVLEFCNAGETDFVGNLPEHKYRIYVSDDNGESFSELCVVPFDTKGLAYGSMLFREDGSLIVYAYDIKDECNMSYVISADKGQTWNEPNKCHVAKKIRNPQTAILNGTYILHGRAGATGFVLYTSSDGIHWDEGHMLEARKGGCYYSNNIVLKDENGRKRLLIQYSETYASVCVNIMHMWLETLDK